MNRLTIRNALLPIVDGSSGTWRGRSHLPATARGLLLACLLAAGAFGAEHHGTVLFGGMPVPGATVTATKDDKRLVAITDDRGAYSFPGLADGIWTIKVEMLCFETIKREVAIQADAPPPTWELKLLPPGQLHTVEQQAAPPPKTATPAEPTAAAPAAAPTDGAKSAKGNGKNAQAAAPAQNGFQRTDLKASADAGSIAAEAPEPGGSNQSSGDAYTVNGSMNNGAASPYAQSAAFGNGRKGPRSMYQAALSVTMDNSALDARTFFPDRPGHAQSRLQSAQRNGFLWRAAADSARDSAHPPAGILFPELPMESEPQCHQLAQPGAHRKRTQRGFFAGRQPAGRAAHHLRSRHRSAVSWQYHSPDPH